MSFEENLTYIVIAAQIVLGIYVVALLIGWILIKTRTPHRIAWLGILANIPLALLFLVYAGGLLDVPGVRGAINALAREAEEGFFIALAVVIAFCLVANGLAFLRLAFLVDSPPPVADTGGEGVS